LPQQIKLAVDRWLDIVGVDEPRGTVIYCYVEPSRVLAEAMSETSKMLRHAARDLAVPVPVLPIRRVPGTQHTGIYPRRPRRITKMRLFVLFVPFVDYFSKEENEALEKVEHGLRMADAGKIAWGAADLLKLQERMAAEPRAWTAAQISEIQPHYDRARQAVIMHFREWLDRQAPHGDTLDVVSAFNTKMINVIGADLKKIGLDEQHAALEARTRELLRQAHTITDARQLLRDVDSLISRATIAARTIRMAELRSLIEQGKGYAAKLAGMSARVSLPEIGTARAQLATLLAKLKQATDEVAKRGKQIWKKKLQSAEDIGQLLSEVESLINTYEAS